MTLVGIRHIKALQVVVIGAACTPLSAQDFYLGVDGGYGLGMAGYTQINQTTTYSPGNTTTEYETKTYSLGKGVQVGFFAGYKLNPDISFELNVSYLLGSSGTVVTKEILSNNLGTNTSRSTRKGKMLRIIPTMKVCRGNEKIYGYLKTGFIIGILVQCSITEFGETVWPFVYNTEMEIKYTGGMGFGFHGGAGINYMPGKNLGVFVELAGYFQNWMTKENGQLAHYSNNFVTGPAPYTTLPAPQTPFPFSSIGLNAGIQLSLTKK